MFLGCFEGRRLSWGGVVSWGRLGISRGLGVVFEE